MGRNSKILFTYGQSYSLAHLLNEFVSASRVVDFSGGLLCLKCGETEPMKIFDVSKDGEPQIITLPADELIMNVLASPNGTFVLSIAKNTLHIWKRKSSAVEFDHFLAHSIVLQWKCNYILNNFSCFSNDFKVAILLDGESCG